jgi:regulator of cell morphogenesis and NO signaling
MSQMTTQTQVGEFVAELPGRYRVFQDYGIDFCCGGKQPLQQACREKGLDVDAVLKKLMAYRPTAEDGASVTGMSLTQLCDLIETKHHGYIRDAIPRLTQMSQKVANAHGANHPEMHKVRDIVGALCEEMTSHMMKEERVLFPAIRQLEAGDGHAASHCGSVMNPIHVMEMEHESAGGALAQMRQLTNNFTAPADACNTFRALLSGIQEFEADLHQHVHKENNVLFPRAILREDKLRGGR